MESISWGNRLEAHPSNNRPDTLVRVLICLMDNYDSNRS